MDYRILGRTGVRVSAHCLGTMMLGPWGTEDEAECIRIVHTALDHGINFIDTADVYSDGVSEEIVGKAIRDRRDEVVLATKVFGQMGSRPNERGLSRLWIMREVENSLRRLGTDHIDLYQVHRPDHDVDVEETLDALTDLVRQGKVRYLGTSTFSGWQLVEAQWASERRSLARFVCEQTPSSILVRHTEQDVFPVAQQHGMGVLAWSPLAGGWLTGKYRRGEEAPPGSRAEWARERGGRVGLRFDPSRPGTQRKMDVLEQLAPIAAKAGLSLTHLSVAFTLTHPAVTSTIIGPKTLQQLDDLLAGADVQLEDDTLDAIDAVVEPGTSVDQVDRGWDPPWMASSARRP